MERNFVVEYRLPDRSKYTGQCIYKYGNIELSGKGTIQYSNGDMYEGEFENGHVRGFGKYTFEDMDVHIGYFYNGIPNGLGYLNHFDSMCIGFFKNGKLNGWGIQINKRGIFSFGWWVNNELVQNETNNVQWIRDEIDLKINIYKGSLVTIKEQENTMLFGIPQISTISILDNSEITHLPVGFLFNNSGELIVADKLFSTVNGWLVKYLPDKSIEYGFWVNGQLVKKGDLSNFQRNYSEADDYFKVEFEELSFDIDDDLPFKRIDTQTSEIDDDLPF